jgi:hypothetical protein
MRRREFIAGLGGAATWLSTVRAQATGRPPLVAFIWLYSENQEAPVVDGGKLSKECNCGGGGFV